MWCEKCKADVAAMASPDNERLHCTACSSELPRPVAAAAAAGPARAGGSSAKKPLSDPRELLARWAREDALGSLDLSPPVARTPAPDARPQLRFDDSHTGTVPQSQFVERVAARTPSAEPQSPAVSEITRHDLVVHPPHTTNPPPHFQSAPLPLGDKSSRRLTFVGQLCAYFGVGALFIGTVLILMSYFGGPASYSTTGWLVTTAGQMLLFLGVITLVSGGMEQTTQEVARRIDTLGERLIRIEQATARSVEMTNVEARMTKQ